jgi:hypothetical protein
VKIASAVGKRQYTALSVWEACITIGSPAMRYSALADWEAFLSTLGRNALPLHFETMLCCIERHIYLPPMLILKLSSSAKP